MRAAFAVAREDDQGYGVGNQQADRKGGRRDPATPATRSAISTGTIPTTPQSWS